LGRPEFSLELTQRPGRPNKHFVYCKVRDDRHRLAHSRGFGDTVFYPAIIAEPEVVFIARETIRPGTVFALCSDGAEHLVDDCFHVAKTYGSWKAADVRAELEPVVEHKQARDLTAIIFDNPYA
jgi:hypothetical protein